MTYSYDLSLRTLVICCYTMQTYLFLRSRTSISVNILSLAEARFEASSSSLASTSLERNRTIRVSTLVFTGMWELEQSVILVLKVNLHVTLSSFRKGPEKCNIRWPVSANLKSNENYESKFKKSKSLISIRRFQFGFAVWSLEPSFLIWIHRLAFRLLVFEFGFVVLNLDSPFGILIRRI